MDTPTAALLAARTDGERIALVSALERRGPLDLAAAAQRALPAGNGDVVALVLASVIPESRGARLDAARCRAAQLVSPSVVRKWSALAEAIAALVAHALSPAYRAAVAAG